ncbi:MAG: serine/threonine protein kinase [Bacteroidota bacterium]
MSGIIGKKIDIYEVTGRIGKGGMGVVYRGKDTLLDRDVALKFMDFSLAEDKGLLKRFQDEAKALERLNYPNIVTVLTMRPTDYVLCIVMELIEGETLADRLHRSGALPPSEVGHIFTQLLSAVGHAHKAKIFHRDLKPMNVMLTRESVVKVLDFGLAKSKRRFLPQ